MKDRERERTTAERKERGKKRKKRERGTREVRVCGAPATVISDDCFPRCHESAVSSAVHVVFRSSRYRVKCAASLLPAR